LIAGNYYHSPLQWQPKWAVPLNFKETLNGFGLFKKHVLDFQYILINVHAYDEEELLMFSDGEETGKIIKYTGLSRKNIKRLK
jgi:hypothetical protein